MEHPTPGNKLLTMAQELVTELVSGPPDGRDVMATKAILICEVIDGEGQQSTFQIASDTPYWNLLGLLAVARTSVEQKLSDDTRGLRDQSDES